jgi:hypothetical protein
MVEKVTDCNGNDTLIIYSEEIEAVTISNKTKKVRVYCRPAGVFEFRYKKKVFDIDKGTRFDLPSIRDLRSNK